MKQNKRGKIILRIILNLFLSLLFIISTYSQNLDNNFDFYKYSKKLLQNLKKMQNQNYKSPEVDTINFKDIFSFYDYKITRTTPARFRLVAKLPEYMNIITTELIYDFSEDSTNFKGFNYLSNITYDDSVIIFDDSILVDIQGTRKLSNPVLNIIKDRFFLYRTLGLPKIFKPDSLNLNSTVNLFFHARDTDSLFYNSGNKWVESMNRLAKNKMVYSGLLSINLKNSDSIIDFYILITSPNSYGHHFFIIREILNNIKDESFTKSIIVDFYPYVRTDNLLSIYGRDTLQGKKKNFPIKIKRK